MTHFHRSDLQHDTAGTRRVAGVDAESQWDFKPGQPVMTCDGIPGRVQAVQDGPVGGTEIYEVVLEAGLGGGSYSSSELSPLPGSQRTAATAVTIQVEGDEQHIASEDYPELSDILVDRPPLEDAIAVLSGRRLANWVVLDAQGHQTDGPFNDSIEASDARDEREAADGASYSIRNMGDPNSAFQDTFTSDGPNGDFDTEDYPMASFTTTSVAIRPQAGALDWAADKLNEKLPESVQDDGNGRWSYDWCRYRREEHCFYPKDINWAASKEAGYIVWNPVDRGFCMRSKWEDQKACEVGEPGPHSGEPNALVDATIPWEDGGFRQASTQLGDPEQQILKAALADDGFRFHFIAGWTDIQAKAKRIRQEGGVRIISVTDLQVTGEVKGDEGVYQTSLMREPGKFAIAMWECGCNWATYSWGRSGRWKKYEGRMCSHALALNYEVQAEEWGGGKVTEQATAPAWSKDVKVPGDRDTPKPWQVGKPRVAAFKLAMAPIKANPSMEEIVNWYVQQAQQEEPKLTRLISDMATHNGGKPDGLEYRFKKPNKIREKFERKGFDPMRSGDPRDFLDDALRYTIVYHPAIYSAQVQDTLYGLEEAGYHIIEESNTWPRGDTYSDLKYVFEAPSGLHAELQFHTDESLELKQRTLHLLYEEFREASTPLARKQELYDIMASYWEKVEIPPDVLNFPKLRSYPRPASLDPSLRRSLASSIREAKGDLVARVRGQIKEILALLPGGLVKVKGDVAVPAVEVVHPKYDPRAGLNFTGSLQTQAWTEPGTKEYDAHTELNNAVRDGKKKKPSKCSKCGKGGRINGHHHDYSKPLDVKWLCDSCHQTEHAKESSLHEAALLQVTGAKEAEAITIDSEDLYGMLGEFALPPWTDADGTQLGGEIDCAEIAEDLIERVEQTRIAASEPETDLFGEATLHDEPEPALPTTDGSAGGDEIDQMVAQAAGVNASLSGQMIAPTASTGLEWLMDGGGAPGAAQDSADIASAAAQFLATGKVPEPGIQAEAGKRFSHGEQMQIINEGEGVMASNLGDLDIRGTHYEAIQAGFDHDEELW